MKEPSAQASAWSPQPKRAQRAHKKGPFRMEWALGSASVRSVWSRTDTQGRMSPPLRPCGLETKSITPSENHNRFRKLMNELRIAHRLAPRSQFPTAPDRASRVATSRSGRASWADRGTMNTFSLAAPLWRPGISSPGASGADRTVSRTEISR